MPGEAKALEVAIVPVPSGNLHMHRHVVVCSIDDDVLTAGFCSAKKASTPSRHDQSAETDEEQLRAGHRSGLLLRQAKRERRLGRN